MLKASPHDPRARSSGGRYSCPDPWNCAGATRPATQHSVRHGDSPHSISAKICQVSMSFISIGGSQQAGPMVQISLHFPWKIWTLNDLTTRLVQKPPMEMPHIAARYNNCQECQELMQLRPELSNLVFLIHFVACSMNCRKSSPSKRMLPSYG